MMEIDWKCGFLSTSDVLLTFLTIFEQFLCVFNFSMSFSHIKCLISDQFREETEKKKIEKKKENAKVLIKQSEIHKHCEYIVFSSLAGRLSDYGPPTL